MPATSHPDKPKPHRLRELDFLRGIAILLVLLRHQELTDFTQKMGWIGVDLFFVLSGFLVSGLLFSEYQKFGNIRPGLFLIRRGFKIYPIYYLFYILYLAPILIKHQLNMPGLISDMLFVQNYVHGWGYAYRPSWSLAVEEHFYIGFSLLLFWAISRNKFSHDPKPNRPSGFEITVLAIISICLMLRLWSAAQFPDLGARNLTMTHLRIDSLLAGVLVSWWFRFRRAAFERVMSKYRVPLLSATVLLIAWTPFTDYTSYFAMTSGFLMLSVAFSIILAWFLTDPAINRRLNTVFTKPIVNAVSTVGLASYSIYIIHSFVNYGTSVAFSLMKITVNGPVMFVITTIISLCAGMLMTNYIERYFLAIRDRRFPGRTSGV